MRLSHASLGQGTELPPFILASLRNGVATAGLTCGNAVVSATSGRCLCVAPLHDGAPAELARRLFKVQSGRLEDHGALQVALNVNGRVCVLHKFSKGEPIVDDALRAAWQRALALLAAA